MTPIIIERECLECEGTGHTWVWRDADYEVPSDEACEVCGGRGTIDFYAWDMGNCIEYVYSADGETEHPWGVEFGCFARLIETANRGYNYTWRRRVIQGNTAYLPIITEQPYKSPEFLNYLMAQVEDQECDVEPPDLDEIALFEMWREQWQDENDIRNAGMVL